MEWCVLLCFNIFIDACLICIWVYHAYYIIPAAGGIKVASYTNKYHNYMQYHLCAHIAFLSNSLWRFASGNPIICRTEEALGWFTCLADMPFLLCKTLSHVKFPDILSPQNHKLVLSQKPHLILMIWFLYTKQGMKCEESPSHIYCYHILFNQPWVWGVFKHLVYQGIRGLGY